MIEMLWVALNDTKIKNRPEFFKFRAGVSVVPVSYAHLDYNFELLV